MNRLIRYFDLLSDVRPKQAMAKADGTEPKLHWLPQWLALFAGILLQPGFDHYRQHHTWVFPELSGWVLFSLIVSFMIFPSVYKNSFAPEKPIFIQLCPIFVGGMGWEALLKTAAKAVGGD